mmetsp:Transcript_102690/g.265931  ORF Transcript_102690/g.265931 Transcript_102690/m.265931 type:complete len:279 (-) Transcript_102690:2247-3083(-)
MVFSATTFVPVITPAVGPALSGLPPVTFCSAVLSGRLVSALVTATFCSAGLSGGLASALVVAVFCSAALSGCCNRFHSILRSAFCHCIDSAARVNTFQPFNVMVPSATTIGNDWLVLEANVQSPSATVHTKPSVFFQVVFSMSKSRACSMRCHSMHWSAFCQFTTLAVIPTATQAPKANMPFCRTSGMSTVLDINLHLPPVTVQTEPWVFFQRPLKTSTWLIFSTRTHSTILSSFLHLTTVSVASTAVHPPKDGRTCGTVTWKAPPELTVHFPPSAIV